MQEQLFHLCNCDSRMTTRDENVKLSQLSENHEKKIGNKSHMPAIIPSDEYFPFHTFYVQSRKMSRQWHKHQKVSGETEV